MRIANKLFLIIISLGLGLQLSASEYQPQDDKNLLNFISGLKTVPKAAALQLARWMETTYATDQNLSNQLMDIVNTNQSVADKTKAIEQLKQRAEQPETDKNRSYFANISTAAKTAAAFVITVGIASYLYFMRPWSSSTTQQ